MSRRRTHRVGLVAICFLAAASPAWAPEYAVTVASDLATSVPKVVLSETMTNPVGFAWEIFPDGSHELLWAVDPGQRKVVRVEVSGQFRREYNVGGSANLDSIFFNNYTRRLWALDADGTTLYRDFEVVGTGLDEALVPVAAANAVIDQVAHRAPINGITLDPGLNDNLAARLIWVSRGGGLCSCIELRDPDAAKGEEIIGRFFPKCEPVDISIGPDGKRLWILADNGSDKPMVLIERRLYGAPSKRAAAARNPVERFYVFDREFRPSAIAAALDGVWLMVGPRQSDIGRQTGNQTKTYAILLEVNRLPRHLLSSWGSR